MLSIIYRTKYRVIRIKQCISYCTKSKGVRVGCASGFWGDTAVAAHQLVNHGKLDYLVLDYLSEITMSLMTAAKHKSPDMGYAPDFVQAVLAPNLKNIKEKGIRVVTNAGGVNVGSCAAAIQALSRKLGLSLKVATVSGDDLMHMKTELEQSGIVEMQSGAAFPRTVHSMNAYLGAGAIKRALDLGADVVVTGRCVDSALVLAPLIHEFKWSTSDYDLMAAGSLAGHLIECGAQVTGGIFTDWHLVPDWHNIGFPIVDCSANGEFIVTKPPRTGGLVSTATVAEQLVYEIGDPTNYILPDVMCDFSQVTLQLVGDNTVRVQGAKGKAPTSDYKVSATYADGYRATAVCCVGGPLSDVKGRCTAQAILNRCRGTFRVLGLADFTQTHVQILGAEDSYGAHARPSKNLREAVVWMAAHHKKKEALEIFSREIAPAGTGMAPGLTGIVGGRPRVSPVLKLYSFLYPKNKTKVSIHMDGELVEEYDESPHEVTSSKQSSAPIGSLAETLDRGARTYRLEELAYTRSGDKGNSVNIGVIARKPEFFAYLKAELTAERVAKYLEHLFDDNTQPLDKRIQRYELPGIYGLNFVLHQALGGGGIASLRADPQGKAMGQMLLDLEVTGLPEFTR